MSAAALKREIQDNSFDRIDAIKRSKTSDGILSTPGFVNKIDPETNLSQCFHSITSKLYVSISPIFLNDPISGIKQQHLDPLLMSYYPEAKGVILSYSNIKFLRNSLSRDSSSSTTNLLGNIKFDTPFAFLWVSVDFLIWRPLVGNVIQGHVYMQSPSHIGLLIHDTFNANIKKFNIPETWEFVPNDEDVGYTNEEDEETAISGNIDTETGDSVEPLGATAEKNTSESNVKSLGYWKDANGIHIGGELKFMINSIHTSGRFVNIEGSLLDINSDGTGSNFGFAKKSQKKIFNDDEINSEYATRIPESAKEELGDMLPANDEESATNEKQVIAEANSSEDDDDSD